MKDPRQIPEENMRYPQRILNVTGASGAALGYARGAALVILATAGLSGCAGRWFDMRPQGKGNADQTVNVSPGDLRSSAVTYIQGLCALPREQREPQVRGLNEALLPNHATISCGRGGGGPPLSLNN
jgi:hypothetical protein